MFQTTYAQRLDRIIPDVIAAVLGGELVGTSDPNAATHHDVPPALAVFTAKMSTFIRRGAQLSFPRPSGQVTSLSLTDPWTSACRNV
jgi:hypothetical protein